MNRALVLAVLAVASFGRVQAQDQPEAQKPPAAKPVDQEVRIEGKADQTPPVERLNPPSHAVGDEVLRIHKYDDIHRVLRLVPGVYMREEDGYGLRPNIGFRGTTTDRSSKVTLMEDGILSGPAPYTAPAAYYFPMTTRMQSVETITGPGILRYGPQLVGGAVNLKTRDIPRTLSGSIDVAGGSYGYGKIALWAGAETWTGDVGFSALLEGAFLRSGGFKDLDGGGDTGFWKTEMMAKGALLFGGEAHPQRLQLKLGYGREQSNETYLGLADRDFDPDPYRRYRGSQIDQMNWHRLQLELSHAVELGKNLHLTSAVYYHDFDRIWEKINRFATGPDLHTLLGNPTAGLNGVYYAVLKGDQNTTNPGEDILIGTNDRSFIAEGIQSELVWSVDNAAGKVEQATQLGIRYHHDQAVRRHTEDAFAMTNGKLVSRNQPELSNLDTNSFVDALALHAAYTHRFGPIVLTPRLRTEILRTVQKNHLTGADQSESAIVLLPGLLAAWEIDEIWALRAGVYRGFTPKTPGQSEDIDPETSVNYELGVEVASGQTRALVTGFFNDYKNLTAEDTFASGGNGSGRQFNGGEVNIYGLEVAASHRFELGGGVNLPLTLAYTYLHSEFLTTFFSANAEFGDVEKGDALPYLPSHQLTGSIGLEGESWMVSFLVNVVSRQREVAGRGSPAPYDTVPARSVFDVNASWKPWPAVKIYVNVLNALDREYLVSHRPYGARPGLPREFQIGLDLRF